MDLESLLTRLGAEVRQAMHHVIGLTELASEDLLSESQTLCLSRSRGIADQLVRTVNDLTELGRTVSITSDPAPFDLPAALAEVNDLMAALARTRGLTFDWLVDPAVPACITGDKFLLQDILYRAIDGAIRFTPRGGIQISIATAALAGTDRGSLLLDVATSATGASQDLLTVFSGAAPTAPLESFALRIAQKRSMALGGSLTVQPNSIGGATLRISLPMSVPAKAAAPLKNRPATWTGPPLRILVAEDSEESFELFLSYTHESGHAVSRAHDGVQAVEMAKRGTFDFIVMDVNMPGMNGYDATRLIREWETSTGQIRRPVLLFSADDFERQVRLGGAAGCSGFLAKPATKTEVAAALAYYANPGLEAKNISPHLRF